MSNEAFDNEFEVTSGKITDAEIEVVDTYTITGENMSLSEALEKAIAELDDDDLSIIAIEQVA